MSFQPIIDKIKPELEKIEQGFQDQLLEIRAGRVPISLIKEIKIDCFGSVLPLKQLGAISASGKEIVIQLWDKSYLESVVKAIGERKMDVGVRTEGSNVFLSAPPLTEESKKNLVRALNDKKEESFQAIRRLRDKAWKEIQEGERAGAISEDDKYRGKDKLEELIKEFREKIEERAENKAREIQE